MVLPELSHLQYLALRLIEAAGGKVEGQDLQSNLDVGGGGERSGPAFYMFMGRLKESEWVQQKKEARERTQVAVYKLTRKGRGALRRAEKFYGKKGSTS